MSDLGAIARWLAGSAPEPLVMATSGSTGEPKPVLISRSAVRASAEATASRLAGPGAWLLALPTTSIAGVMVVARSVLAGRPVVPVDRSWATAVGAAGDGPRYTALVPTQLHRALDEPADAAALGQLDAVLVGGAAVDLDLIGRARDLGVRLVRTYGMTETCGGCVYDGRPLDGVRVRIADDGRIELAGPMLFDGYAGQRPVGEWFTTSDRGEFAADGRLVVTGRVDDIAISGGVNVPTPAVRTALRGVQGVRDVEVLGVPDAEWGERVVAFVVGTTDLATLRDSVRPRSWAPRQLVMLDALPLLASGKVDRVRLRAMAVDA